MTYKQKYEDLDRSKLPEKAIVIIDTMKKDSKGFTDTEALEVIGPKFDQVIEKLKSSGYEEAFKSMQKKEPEPKTPVAVAKKIVKDAVKQPKTTAKTAKPTVGAFKKGAVGELAKKIRKEGEAWPSALKRAGQMIKEQKSGVQKKATAQYKKLNALLAKMPALGKGSDTERDAPRKAKPIGKRTAKSGNTYYEYRANRTDVRQGKGYPYLKLGAMLAKGGEISKIFDKVQMFDEISEKEINYIVKKMNDANGVKNFDSELKSIVDWVWDNEPRLSKEQDEKGIKFLKNLAFMANGKSRSNSPFGSREEYTLKNFTYMKLRGFHDVAKYGQPERYVPLFTVYDDEGYGFEYYYHAGKVNVVGEKGMSIKKKGKVEVDFFDSDKKVQDFLNLSRVQFMARYKETKDRYQQMVNAITRNIEGVFMHGGKMAGAGQFGGGHYMADGGVIKGLDANEFAFLYIKRGLKSPYREDYLKPIGLWETPISKDVEKSLISKGLLTSNGAITTKGKDLAKEIDTSINSEFSSGYLGALRDKRASKFESIKSKFNSSDNGGIMADGGHIAKSGKYYVMDAKDGKIVSKGFDTEEEAKVEKFKIFEKTNNFFLTQKKMAKGGLTNIKGTTEPKAYPQAEPNTNVVV
jgi:hypothetical protein